MSIYSEYQKYIGEFIETDSTTWKFKSNPIYTYVLEHVSHYEGYQYISEIKNRFNDFFEKNKEYLIGLCNKNDNIGSPNKYYFEGFTECSPTNIRYILHSLLILTHMEEMYITETDIVEIGGGYGGLCFFIKNLSRLFGIKINSYTIFDLEEPMLLQKKYLSLQNINNVLFKDLYTFDKVNKNSFLISCYAFSEIDMQIQKDYTEKLLNPYISHGFITWNHIPIYDFIEDKTIISEREYPLTGNNNYYLRF